MKRQTVKKILSITPFTFMVMAGIERTGIEASYMPVVLVIKSLGSHHATKLLCAIR